MPEPDRERRQRRRRMRPDRALPLGTEMRPNNIGKVRPNALLWGFIPVSYR